jgi:hypothetical protein
VARLLAYVIGKVNQQLLLQNEYLLAQNRILRAHLPSLERPHQGKGNQLLFPRLASPRSPHPGPAQCHERLGGLLKFYQRAA